MWGGGGGQWRGGAHFPVTPVVKNPPANTGDTGDTDLIPESEDPLEEEIALLPGNS